MRLSNNILGISFKFLNLLVFTVKSLVLASVSKQTSLFYVIFILNIVAIASFIPWIFFTKGRYLKINNIKRLSYYILRTLFNILGIFSWVKAMQMIGTNEASAISYIIPILTTLLAVIFCNEKLNKKCLIAIFISLIGVYITLEINSDNFLFYGSVVAIFSSFMWASYDIVCKKQSKNEHYLTQTFYTFLFSFLLLLPLVLFYHDSPFYIRDIKLIIIAGILSPINVTILFLAYKYAPIYILMPFSYCRLIFMFIGSYFVFNVLPSSDLVIGSCLIAGSSLYVFYENYKNKL